MDEVQGVRIAVLEERLKGMGAALALQAQEYERRLAELNHAHAQQTETQRTYVSMDKFEGFVRETNSWREQVRDALALGKGRSSGLGSAQTLVFQILPFLLALAAFVLAYVKR